MCRLVCGGEVGQIEPVPGCDQDVFRLDVAVINIDSMTVAYSGQQLKREPFLLNFL